MQVLDVCTFIEHAGISTGGISMWLISAQQHLGLVQHTIFLYEE